MDYLRKAKLSFGASSIIFTLLGIGIFFIPYTNNYGEAVTLVTILMPLFSAIFLIIGSACALISIIRPEKNNRTLGLVGMGLVILSLLFVLYILNVDIN